MSVSKLVSGVAAMPEEAKRKISCIIGAVVADAASLPLEWIYKDDTMTEIVGEKNPEFWPESHCPFYTVPTGSVSCYTDEMLTTLDTLAKSDAELDISKVTAAVQAKFGSPDSPYQVALAKRAEKKYPVPGPWINGGVIKSLANMQAGTQPTGSDTCEDNDGLAVCLPAYLLKYCPVQAATTANILTTNNTAITHMKVQTQIINNFIKGVEDPVDAAKDQFATELPEVAKEISDVTAAIASGKSVKDIVATFGKACGLPGSFQGALASILIAPDFVSAVRKNILAGGDCNARANFIGACLGAKFGIEGIPMEWIEKVTNVETVIENTVKVFASSK